MLLQLNNFNRINRNVFYLTFIGIIFSGCTQHESTNCYLTNTLRNSISIKLPDSIVKRQVADMQFSDFEKDRIWIKPNKGYDTIFVVDVNTKDISVLDKRLNQAFYNPSQMIYDSFDSVYWISGYKLVRYNHVSKIISEYNIGYNKFYNTPLRLYFVTSDTLRYFNKNTFEISSVKEMIGTKIGSIKALNDSLLWINNSLTFNLFTSEIQLLEDSFRNNLYKNNYSFHSLISGIEFYSNEGRLYWIGKNRVNELPYGFQSNKNVVVENGSIWQYDYKFILQYDITSQKLSKYFFRFPFSTLQPQNFYIKEGFVWFNPQPYAISLADSALYTYRMSNNDQPLKLLIDDCNTYVLQSNRIEITPLNLLIKSLKSFDARAYDSAATECYSYIYERSCGGDTSILQVMNTIESVKKRYADSENEEIQDGVKRFSENHYYCIKLNNTKDYEVCITNNLLPKSYRNNCYNSLMRNTARSGLFYNLLHFYDSYENISNDSLGRKYRAEQINIIKNYLNRIDSLEYSKLPKDSIEYLKAESLLMVCQTYWFEAEVMFNFSLYKSALTHFIKKFPNSSLVDNADFSYWSIYYAGYYEEGNPDGEWAEKIIESYNRLLRKYPESDVKDKMDYAIFDLKYWSRQYSDKQIITSAKRFIQLYPSSIHIKDVESRIENIFSRQPYFH